MRRAVALLVLGPLVAGLGGCGDAGDAGPATTGAAGCRSADDGRLTVVADDLAWDTDCLEAPAGDLTLVVENRDAGVNHNIHLPDAPGGPQTQLEAGPVTQELEVSLEEGSYEYVCDIHPTMVGTLTVADASPSDTR